LRETRARAEVSGVNIDIVPLGERAQRSILDHVLAVGDEAETNYLEAKSALDLTSIEGVAKIAKFLLGAANRRPQEAARYFHGYAVLVIGAQEGHADGVPRGLEAHELEDRLALTWDHSFPRSSSEGSVHRGDFPCRAPRIQCGVSLLVREWR